jgi:hypothetical protein
MTVTERMKQGKTECARDPRTGEIVIRWSHYDPITEQDVPFSTRFHPRDYVTDAQLRSDYHLTTHSATHSEDTTK